MIYLFLIEEGLIKLKKHNDYLGEKSNIGIKMESTYPKYIFGLL